MPPEVRRIGFIAIIGVVMAFLDSTIVNVALASVSESLRMSIEMSQWVITAYLLALAASATVSTWAAKRLGSPRLYQLSLLVFTVASLLCGVAQTAWQLVTFRFVQGAAAGIMAPAAQMLLVEAAGPKPLARALAAFGVPVMLAPVLGPPVGGLIVGLAGWRWIFLINLPIGVLGTVLALKMLRGAPTDRTARFDVLGLVLVTPGIAMLTYGLTKLGNSRLAGDGVLVPLLAGLVLLAAFVIRAVRVPHPLLDLTLYRNRAFSVASLACFAMGAVIFGATILMPLYLQWVRGEGAASTGVLLAAQGIGIALAMWRSGVLFDRFGAAVVVAGAAVALVATVPLAFLTPDTTFGAIVVVLAVRGAGIGLANMPAMSLAYQALQPSQLNEASTQLNVLQRLGGSLGTAAFIVVLHERFGDRPRGVDVAADAAAFGTAFAVVAGVTALAVVPAVVLMVDRRRGRVSAGAARAGQSG
jgi:EmrB/QacA subfamily drug resistance transporter